MYALRFLEHAGTKMPNEGWGEKDKRIQTRNRSAEMFLASRVVKPLGQSDFTEHRGDAEKGIRLAGARVAM